MNRTETGATVVLAMRRQRAKKGQALIEYAFLLVLLAAISFAVILAAGTQLQTAYGDVTFEFVHLTDPNTYAPDGSVVPPGTTVSCQPGTQPALRGHKWKCH
jgi:Flp pilus assembly pilin Flp